MRPIACGRACANHITGPQFDEARQIFDLPRDIENHVRRAFVLFDFAVEFERELQIVWISYKSRRHEVRSERQIRRRPFCGNPVGVHRLHGIAAKDMVTIRAVVDDGIARDVTKRFGFCDVTRFATDDDGEFQFPVRRFRVWRQEDVVIQQFSLAWTG